MPTPKTRLVQHVSLRIVREGTIRYATALTGPDAAADVARQLIGDADRECVAAMFLDRRNRVIAAEVASIGSASSVLVDPAIVFRGALLVGAVGLVLAHNHVSGQCVPSPEDITVTRSIIAAGKVLGLPLIDHLVIGDPAFASIRTLHPDLGWAG